MSSYVLQKRREFLKKTASGTAAMFAAGMIPKKAMARQGGWHDGMEINPDISNYRVVYAHNESMNPGGAVTPDLGAQVNSADGDAVKETVDKMAMALTETGSAEEAWGVIFRKPDNKQWGDVVAQLKVNNFCGMFTSVPAVNAICSGLVAAGVQANKISLYDRNDWQGQMSGQGGNLLQGVSYVGGDFRSPDILVDAAVNKVHDAGWGNCTLCLKNHIGSAEGNFGNYHSSGAVVDMNKSDRILGSGDPPRQQLAFVDSIWAAKTGSWNTGVTHSPCYLIMGTHAAVVDYLTVREVRRAVMDGVGDPNWFASRMGDFGLDSNNAAWINAMDYTPVAGRRATKASARSLEILVNSQGGRIISLGDRRIDAVTIHDARGRLIRELAVHDQSRSWIRISWDGRTSGGRTLAAGTYIARVTGQGLNKAARLVVR